MPYQAVEVLGGGSSFRGLFSLAVNATEKPKQGFAVIFSA
jgi:hypothetical protein